VGLSVARFLSRFRVSFLVSDCYSCSPSLHFNLASHSKDDYSHSCTLRCTPHRHCLALQGRSSYHFYSVSFSLLSHLFLAPSADVLIDDTPSGQPGYIAIIQPFHEYGYAFFPVSRFNLQVNYMWKTKTDLYRKYNSNVLVIPSLFPPVVTILIADAQVSFRISSV